jgi:translation elongation factor EF-G
MGTVLGHLSSIGGHLENVSDDVGGLSTIRAKLPIESIPGLRNVLAILTKGEVQVVPDHAANSEDA